MLTVEVTEKGGQPQLRDFDRDKISIGRNSANDLVLTRGQISKRHCVVYWFDSVIYVEDLESTNGTFVNGKRVSGTQALKPKDRIYIGEYILSVTSDHDEQAPEAEPEGEPEAEPEPEPEPEPIPTPTPAPASKPAPRAKQTPAAASEPMPMPMPTPTPTPIPPPAVELRDLASIQKDVHDRLISYLDLKHLNLDKLGEEDLRSKTEQAIQDIVDQMEADGELLPDLDTAMLVKDVLNEALGLGPLEEFLQDNTVSEIMVNHANQIFIERNGQIEQSEKCFSSNQAVLGAIERIVAPIGRRIDESSPLVDARLKDGSRVNAIIPPLALKGPCITIRKFKKEKLQVKDLIRFGSISPQMAEFLELCVQEHRNIVISGGTGSGKTTLLNVLTSFIGQRERIITIEDAAELQIYQPHWIQLESRPPNLEGKGQITIRDLVKNCLRMRPDRIVVGECRSGETLDMLQAMNTGHDGSLTTLHANTPRDALARMETMCLMAGMDLPLKAIREQIAAAIHIIVQQTRFSDGSRRVEFITEVAGMEVDIITLQDIFYFKREGLAEDGKVLGRFLPSGFMPKFFDKLRDGGRGFNMNIFQAPEGEAKK